jgi:hypothetical protein
VGQDAATAGATRRGATQQVQLLGSLQQACTCSVRFGIRGTAGMQQAFARNLLLSVDAGSLHGQAQPVLDAPHSQVKLLTRPAAGSGLTTTAACSSCGRSWDRAVRTCMNTAG